MSAFSRARLRRSSTATSRKRSFSSSARRMRPASTYDSMPPNGSVNSWNPVNAARPPTFESYSRATKGTLAARLKITECNRMPSTRSALATMPASIVRVGDDAGQHRGRAGLLQHSRILRMAHLLPYAIGHVEIVTRLERHKQDPAALAGQYVIQRHRNLAVAKRRIRAEIPGPQTHGDGRPAGFPCANLGKIGGLGRWRQVESRIGGYQIGR